MSELKNKVVDYIGKTKFAVLATIGEDNAPKLRTIASFANDELKIYFSTGKSTAKVKQIKENPEVTLLFQHEGQQLAEFRNIILTGTAKILDGEEEFEKAVNLLGARSQRFKERVEQGQLEDTLIFVIEPKKVKSLDFSKGIGPNAIEEMDTW